MAKQNEQNEQIDTAERSTLVIPADQVQAIIAAAVKAALEVVGARPSMDEQMKLMERQAELTAQAHQKLARPENIHHPGHSVYSRPEGEQANPKGDLPYKMTWGGTDVFAELLTAEEFDLLKALVPGEYRCTRGDGTMMIVNVVPRRNDINGKLERMDVAFKTSGGLKNNLPSMVAMAQEMIAQHASRSAAALVG